ncbi:MAG: 3D domain-containing protein [Candidatus Andersenbacteria bacterium]|nr:3D domain-containing protein [Candidatus Andersenbacteria bacterium]
MRGYNHHHTSALIHRGREAVWDTLDLFFLAVFLAVNLFPADVLAFAQDLELSHLPLVFVRDQTLADRAIVGIEAWPPERTVAALLQSPSLAVRLSLAEGSVVRVLATAYSSTIDQTDASPFITASGTHVGPGVVAANFLPFGTRVRVGQQMYTVWDRLNERYNEMYIIDIWQPSRMQAIAFGARVVEMEIVSLP